MGGDASPVVTVEEAMAYLGIDYADEMVAANLGWAVVAADASLGGAVGEGVDASDPRARHVALAVVADIYDNRSLVDGGSSGKVSSATRRLVADLCAQLRLEARAREWEAGS